MENENRRRHRRLSRAAALTVRELTFPLGSRPAEPVEMTDVSEGGLGFLSGVSYAVGTVLETSISLSGWYRRTSAVARYREDDKPLTAVARVTRCAPAAGGGFEVGVEFTDIWAEHWRAMRGHLEGLLGEDEPA